LDKKNIEDILALTPMQEGLLFHYLKDPQSDHYFEQLSLEITGKIDLQHFEKAWSLVVETNEMLRTVFRWEKVEKPVQIVLKEHKLRPVYYDLPGKNAREGSTKQETIEEVTLEDWGKKFDLQEVPFRVTLCKVDKYNYVMILSSHHILYDGWSNGIILKEFFNAYHALSSGDGWVKPSKPRFKEFTERYRKRSTRDIAAHKNYWQKYLKGFDSPTVFSIKGNVYQEDRVSGYSDNCGNLRFQLPKGRMEDFVKEHKITLAALLYGAWGILLQKYNNSKDVVFGTTVSGRSGAGAGIGDCVGMFINTIPLRVTAGGNSEAAIPGFLSRINRELRGREDFESTSLVDIKNYSQLRGDEDLFDTLVVIENYPLEKSLARGSPGELSISNYSMFERTHYDFTVIIKIFDDVEVNLHYNNRLFSDAAVRRLAGHFKNTAESLVSDPGKWLWEIDILSEEEKRQLLMDFNDTETAYPADKTLHQLFEEQVERTPSNVALVGKAQGTGHIITVTYEELNEKSNHLALQLQEKGVHTGAIAGIMAARSVEMVMGVLGILKAGGAYLPIIPDYPEERIQYILRDSSAKILVSKESRVSRDCDVIDLDGIGKEVLKFPTHPLTHSPTHPCYIIYTSGSTGKPKGVVVEHRSVVNTLWALQAAYPLLETDTYLLKTTYSFDVSVTELFGWYLGGGRLAILEKDGEKDPGMILDTIESCRVTHINFVPSMFNVFLEALTPWTIGKLSGLKYIFLAGEALLPGLVEKTRRLGLDSGIALENIYGPTEAAVYSSWYSLKHWRGRGSIPIGTPLNNVYLYILGLDGQLQPIGAAGELHISGVGVARGYLNRPELTAEKFVSSSLLRFSASQLLSFSLYRTGDLARWLPDGNIAFLGRIDHQVKLRGFRIELGEIESCLGAFESVGEVVVMDRVDAGIGKYLCAYVVPADGKEVDPEALTKRLASLLPGYMIPSCFVSLDRVPLPPSGKVDRCALPKPEVKTNTGYTAPQDRLEETLVEIWSRILGIEKSIIGIDSDFFRLGGHSLKATMLSSSIHKELNVKVPLSAVFDFSTVRQLAEYVKRIGSDKQNIYRPIPPTKASEYYRVSSAQKRLYILHQMEARAISYNMFDVFLLEGETDKEKLAETLNKLVDRHESLRTSFHLIDEEPVQKIHQNVHFEISTHKGDYDSHRENITRPFDLSQAPLFRVGLIELDKAKHILVVVMHHIISDGTSVVILIKDFMVLYKGDLSPPLKIQYKDYAEWQNHEKQREDIKAQGEYWLKEFAEDIPLLDIPTDYPREGVRSFEGRLLDFQVSREQANLLKRLAAEEDVTLFMLLIAIFYVLLWKISGSETIVVGTPAAGRRHADVEPIIGMFVNTLALKCCPKGDQPFHIFLEEVKEKTLKAFENQDYPFEDLVDHVMPTRESNRNPLFDPLFVLQNMEDYEIRIPGLEIKPYKYERNIAQFDLFLIGQESKDGSNLFFQVGYSSKLFNQNTIERFIGYFKDVIAAVVKNKDIRLKDIKMSHDLLELESIMIEEVEGDFGF
jgi:tyrocidine synthetase-3